MKRRRNRLTAEEMIKKIMENDTEFLDKEIEEISTTNAVPGYMTPAAFALPDQSDEETIKKAIKKTGAGYEPAVNKRYNTYKLWEMKLLDEATYRQFVKDDSMNARQKVNTAIHVMNSKLFEIEKIVRQSIRLKYESGINREDYWKSTQRKLGKIRERVMKLAVEIQKFGE